MNLKGIASLEPTLAEKEVQDYSICRAILTVADQLHGKHVSCPELERSDALYAAIGARHANIAISAPAFQPRRDAFLLPISVMMGKMLTGAVARALLDSATSTKGLELKFTEDRPYIEMLRQKMMVGQLGAQIFSGLRSDVAFPQQTGQGTASWEPESPTADVAISNLLLNQVPLRGKEVRSYSSYSRKLLNQAVAQMDVFVASDMAAIQALKIDEAAINGLGTSNQPTGILNTAGIGSVTLGANGAQPVWDNLVDMETQLGLANADIGDVSLLTTPGIRARLRKQAKISASTGVPIWGAGEVMGYRAEATKQVPSNLTKGTSTTIAHALLLGRFSEVLLGIWDDAVLVVVDPFTRAKRGDIEIVSTVIADVGLRHAASMVAIKDALQ